MAQREIHAVVFHDRETDQWVALCLEYHVVTQGRSAEDAFEMIREAVELHLECADPYELEAEYQEVDGVPEIRKLIIDAPAPIGSRS
jgi:predicted RNase H-like HicB family nuclease